MPFGDSYREVEGAVFVSAAETTLILQNAASSGRTFDPTDGHRLPTPTSVEIVATSDLNDSARRAVKVDRDSSTGAVAVPAYSVIRVVWPGQVDF